MVCLLLGVEVVGGASFTREHWFHPNPGRRLGVFLEQAIGANAGPVSVVFANRARSSADARQAASVRILSHSSAATMRSQGIPESGGMRDVRSAHCAFQQRTRGQHKLEKVGGSKKRKAMEQLSPFRELHLTLASRVEQRRKIHQRQMLQKYISIRAQWAGWGYPACEPGSSCGSECGT